MAGFGSQAQESQGARQETSAPEIHLRRQIQTAVAPVLGSALRGCIGDPITEPPRRRTDLPNAPPRPAVRGPSPAARAFARDPTNAEEIHRIIDRHTTFEGGEARIDTLAAYDEFKALVGDRFSQQDARMIFNYLLHRHMNEARAVGAEMAGSGNPEERRVGLSIGHATSVASADSGHGTVTQNDTSFLGAVLDGRSQQDQEDILRAALGCGFSAASVSAAATTAGIGNTRSVTETAQQMTVLDMLTKRAIERTNELNDVVRRLSEDRESEEYQRSYRNLSLFVGGNTKAETIAANADPDPVIVAAVQGQILRGRLDAGDMSVVPRRTSRVA